MPERILIQAFDLRNEKIVQQHDFYLDLLEDRLIFHISMDTQAPIDRDDHDLGWKDERVHSTVVAKKGNVSDVELTYSDDPAKWEVRVEIAGSGSSVRFFLKKEIEALEIFRKIIAWMF